MKVLVIGSGGREHAIIDKLSESKKVSEIFAAPGNPGMANVATLVDIKVDQKEELLKFAKEHKIDLTVVGPEASLATGIVDLFRENNMLIFGPSKLASQIETSKEFAKKLMVKYNIPTASYKSFDNYLDAINFVKEKGTPIVCKYDGLAQGKGVVVANTFEEADAALKDMLVSDKFGTDKVVIEEYLSGPEFSFMCFVDNENVYPLDISQDHKRAFDNDLGPNTGGMGAYSPVPIISEDDKKYALDKILKPVAKAMCLEGCPFTGVLYGGLMKTKDGIKVIEFNARFGDPETEVVLPRLKNDLYDTFISLINHERIELKWHDLYCLGIVMASKGYPSKYEKGITITGLDKVDGKVYYMGVDVKNGEYVTNGGRVLIVVEMASTLLDARNKALEDIKKIKCDNLFYRKDIAHWSI